MILALSTAFWDALLRGDEAARRWPDGDGSRCVLEKGDRWRKKLRPALEALTGQ